MKATLEISMYPLRDGYIPAIDHCIERLNSYADLRVETKPTCTIVVGDYERVMQALRETIAASHEKFGKAVFVSKIIPDYEPF